MIAHTSEFKQEIAKLGRQIDVYLLLDRNPTIRTQNNYDILTENGDTFITEMDQTPGSQASNPFYIGSEYIYSVEIIRNSSLLKTFMEQCNIELKGNINVGSVFSINLGVLVNDNYEYLDYGKFIVYSKEYNMENETWRYVCYNHMLLAMKKYIRLNVSYPITVKNYITAIANKIGLPFTQNTFINSDKLITKDFFANKNVTYRDILDKLAEITAGTITASNYGVAIRYPQETNDIIDETYLKDINVNFGEEFGHINQIEAVDRENNLSYAVKDDTSIQEYGVNKITITDNPFIFNGEENEICGNILNTLKDISYSINDFTTTGVCYYKILDLFNVSVKGTTYKCLLLNNEIKIQQGIEESIYTEGLDNVTIENNTYQNNYLSNKDMTSKVDQLDSDKVSRNNIVNSLNQSLENSIIRTNKIFIIKEITETTDSDGFLNTNLTYDYIICGATAMFSSNNYGFVIPYYDYNNGSPIWKLKIENKNKVALANTQITATIYYVRKEG